MALNSGNKLDNYFRKINIIVISIIFFMLVVTVFANVIFRYFFESTIDWSEELARFLLIWLIFIGAMNALFENEHMVMDYFIQLFQEKITGALKLIADLFSLAATIALTLGGLELAIKNLNWYSPVLNIPYGYVNMIVPICSSLMAVIILRKIVNDIKFILNKPLIGEM